MIKRSPILTSSSVLRKPHDGSAYPASAVRQLIKNRVLESYQLSGWDIRGSVAAA